MSAKELFQQFLGQCPLIAIIRGVTPGRGGRDRRCDLRKRHPDRRSAAELARSAREHRAAGQAPRRANAGRRRHGPDSRGCRPSAATPEDGSSSRQTPIRDVIAPNGGGGHGLVARLFHAVRSFRRDRRRSDCAQAVPGRRRVARGRSRPSSRCFRRMFRSSSSAASSPTTCSRGSMPGAAGFGLGGGLYKPGQSAAETLDKARAYVAGVKRR